MVEILDVRLAKADDAAAIAELVTELMNHEGKRGGCDARFIERWAFGEDPAFELLVADAGDKGLLGYLAFYRAFTLFKGGPVMLVENLYVRDAARGFKVGKRLMAAAAAEALKRGYVRLELNVRADSRPTIAFYEGLGLFAPGETVYRVEDEELRALAGGPLR